MWGDAHGDAHTRGRLALSVRDRQIVELVGRFRQLEARHVAAALFADHASKTPLDRALKRLVAGHYLVRLARAVGGDGGGSGQYAYQLGRAGWRLLGTSGEYWAYRSVNAHTLAIADCYTQFCQLEHGGVLSVLSFDPEPLCHRRIGSIQLTPDAYAEIGFRERGVKLALWLEVDRATEHGEVIQKKCQRYWQAYQRWDDEIFPYIFFAVPTERRKHEIERIIAAGPDEAQSLFYVCESNELGEVIHTLG